MTPEELKRLQEEQAAGSEGGDPALDPMRNQADPDAVNAQRKLSQASNTGREPVTTASQQQGNPDAPRSMGESPRGIPEIGTMVFREGSYDAGVGTIGHIYGQDPSGAWRVHLDERGEGEDVPEHDGSKEWTLVFMKEDQIEENGTPRKVFRAVLVD